MKQKETLFKKYLAEIGSNIKAVRIKRGLSLEKLGFDIGLDKSNMFRIEKGQNITLVTLLKIAVILEVKPEQLIRVQNIPSAEAIDNETLVKQNEKNNKK